MRGIPAANYLEFFERAHVCIQKEPDPIPQFKATGKLGKFLDPGRKEAVGCGARRLAWAELSVVTYLFRWPLDAGTALRNGGNANGQAPMNWDLPEERLDRARF